MDISSYNAYLNTQYTNVQNTASANSAKESVNGISETSSREEIEDAVKSFEGYFVEQIIKEMKKSVESINDDENSTMSMYKDYFMDSTISQLASEIVDEIGGNITDDFVNQIMRNYGITDTKASEEAAKSAAVEEDEELEEAVEATEEVEVEKVEVVE